MADTLGRIRLDKWLWQARFFKTRSLSAKLVAGGSVRVNGQRVAKPATLVGQADVLTFPQADDVRVIRIVGLGDRRGPAPEARALYEDLSPPAPRAATDPAPHVPRYDGGGRPTKRDRRRMDQSRGEALD
ncbi:RNA-binding S4 domain-containing protein [Puniceibacterium confluentis]|uniref:RNA-binding S4 domain-containing protein n=1 Tax=Puniceibacterium confluentis TaxID=1958944 RepID=UPI0011B4C4EA|nr:RNA-binding S4 domain-containing protein [Puniceibacterium confluentis]